MLREAPRVELTRMMRAKGDQVFIGFLKEMRRTDTMQPVSDAFLQNLRRVTIEDIVHHRARFTFSHNVRYNLACVQLPFYLPRLSCLYVTIFAIFPPNVEIGGRIRVVGRRWGVDNPRWVWHV